MDPVISLWTIQDNLAGEPNATQMRENDIDTQDYMEYDDVLDGYFNDSEEDNEDLDGDDELDKGGGDDHTEEYRPISEL